ncbi:MAG: 30S ribosomal protein S20 [Planctomycetaceae bacterium]
MAHSRTAKKNARKNERRRLVSRAILTATRTQLKRVRAAIASKDGAALTTGLPQAQKMLDKAAKTNRMHKNKASRLKSRLARAAARIGKA